MIPVERIEELIEAYSGYDPCIKLGAVFGTCLMGEFIQLLQIAHTPTLCFHKERQKHDRSSGVG